MKVNLDGIKKIKPIKIEGRGRKSFPVVKYTLDGQPLEIYDSAKDAAIKNFSKEKQIMTVTSHIGKCASGRTRRSNGSILKSAYGFQWRYLHDVKKGGTISEIEPIAPRKKIEFFVRRRRPIVQYDKMGKPIKVYESVIHAATEFTSEKTSFDTARSNICRSANKGREGIRKTAYGYQWRYFEDVKKEGE